MSDITKHIFSKSVFFESDRTRAKVVKRRESDFISIACRFPSGRNGKAVHIDRDDAIAIAKHFKLIDTPMFYEVVKEYVLNHKDDIELGMNDFGTLGMALEYIENKRDV